MIEPDTISEALTLERAAVVPALQAGLYWAGAAEPLPTSAPAALEWLRSRWGAGEAHLPITLVHDLGWLLLRGRAFRLASGRDLERWPPEEHGVRLAYEERVLGHWLLDPSVDAAHLALLGVPEALRGAAVAHAVGLALGDRLAGADLAVGNAAHLRALALPIRDGLPETFADWEAGEEWRAFAAEQHATAIAALGADALFDEADLWELVHFASLPSESQRLALRQLHQVRGRVGAAPLNMAGRIKRRAREVPLDAEHADQFPAGGFDGISQKGRFENLVRSEVAYVGSAVDETVDAFDMRYVLGELLYYTRDESPLLDARRHLTVVVDQPAALREKWPGLPVQTLVMVEGLCLALHADLLAVFGQQAARTSVRWRLHDAADTAVAAEEEALLRTSLSTEIAHHRVDLLAVGEAAPWPAGATVVFSARVAPGRLPRRLSWVQLREDGWLRTPTHGPAEVHALQAGDGARRLLDGLLLDLA